MGHAMARYPQFILAFALFLGAALLAAQGWLSYRENLGAFSRFQAAGHRLQAADGSVQFYCDAHGDYQPATLWQASGVQLTVALQLLLIGGGVLFWRPAGESKRSRS